MHSKVQRSATDALCVMEMGQRRVSREGGEGGGKERGYVMCVYVVCFWQINEPCEGECSALWSCHMHRASRGVASEGGKGEECTPSRAPLLAAITHVQTEHGTTLLHTHISLNSVGSATICCMVDSALRFYAARLLKNLN